MAIVRKSFPTPGPAQMPVQGPVSFAELSVVSLTHERNVNGRMLPEGSKGTVVACYDDGHGYEVEFDSPFHAVVTLEASELSA